MKQLMFSALLGIIVFGCNDANTDSTDIPTEQQTSPNMDLGSQPMSTEAAPGMEETVAMDENSSAAHFDMVFTSLDESHPSEAADHMQMAISALETEAVGLEDSRQQELKAVIEQLDDVTDRLRNDEATDRAEIQQLVDQAETLVGEQQ
ncbi:hypothetical protein [Lewinella sp. IMCC34183]|uniref:hypothetical protein n=1 Tax=Lewinella sp. IMCC34183 TaxID=2248762 RepID=UPI001300B237|nr:hypothetical protein [Lewinella sp. IMCC34183]